MKNTLALVLIVLGSYGAFAEEDCATKPTTEEILECINSLPSEEEERELREAEKRYEKLMAEECSQYLKTTPIDAKSWKECKDGKSTNGRDAKSKVNLICKMVKSGAKKSTDIYDNRGRKIGKTQKQDNEKYSVNIEIDGTKANLSFDEKLLPKLNSGTSLSGTVRTFDDRFVIEYQPNKFNKSTLTINRYSGSAEIEAESFGGLGSTIRIFTDAYEGKRSSKIKKIGSCEGGSEKKF